MRTDGIQPNVTMSAGGEDAIRVIQMIITVMIFLVGIPLNALVVWVLGLRPARVLEARGASSFRVYVVNLALADLVLLMRTPLMLGYLAWGYSWPFGPEACQLVVFLRGLGLYANAFLLCSISVERCLCLLRPVWFRLRRPRWSVLLVCALLWLLAGLLAVPYFSTATLSNINNKSQCHDSDSSLGLGLLVTETLLGFILPLLIFLSSNLVVLLTARHVGEPVMSGTSTSSSSYASERFVHLYRVLFLTMLFFLTFWVPYFIFRFMLKLTMSKPPGNPLQRASIKGTYVALYLVYLKSALNPMLYVFATRGLRRTIQDSLLSTIERIFNDETSDYIRRRSLRQKDSQL